MIRRGRRGQEVDGEKVLDLESLRDILGGGDEGAKYGSQTHTQETGLGWRPCSAAISAQRLQQGGRGNPLKRVRGGLPDEMSRGQLPEGHSSPSKGILQAAKIGVFEKRGASGRD